MDTAQKIKVKSFLKVNLHTLRGEDLDAFMEKYDIREAESGEVMLLDMGYPGKFLAIKNENKNSYFVANIDIVDKILVLEPELISKN